MAENRKQSHEPRDYKERFEFVLTTGGNIICQRYFKINNFNPISLRSYELTRALRKCVSVIDKDLKEKVHTYLSIYAPRIFQSKEEMTKFFSNENNRKSMHLGEGIVINGNDKTDFYWDGEKGVELGYKFDDGEFLPQNVENNKTVYKFAFKVDGREVSAIEWEGMYPKFMRDKIDLSNKRFRFDGDDTSRLSLEQYILYQMVKGKSDLVYGLIKTICYACSQDSKSYTNSVDAILEAWNKDSEKLLWHLM